MGKKTKISIGLVILLVVTVVVTGTLKKQDDQKLNLQVPVSIKQLPHENNIIPVELRCSDIVLTAPNKLEELPCVLINHTNKYIIAGSVGISIITDKDGKRTPDSSYFTFDSFLHPDFNKQPRQSTIPPGGQRPIYNLSEEYDAEVKEVLMQIDYVEFADNSTLGANRAGSRIISDVRGGATKYKNWLVQKYKENGNSIDAVVRLLENNGPLPEELALPSGDQREGALQYRNLARKTYKTKGAKALVNFFE